MMAARLMIAVMSSSCGGADDNGGGMHNNVVSPTVTNVTFVNNLAIGHGGACITTMLRRS